MNADFHDSLMGSLCSEPNKEGGSECFRLIPTGGADSAQTTSRLFIKTDAQRTVLRVLPLSLPINDEHQVYVSDWFLSCLGELLAYLNDLPELVIGQLLWVRMVRVRQSIDEPQP